MNAQLEAIRDAMDKSTGDGRDFSQAVALAEEYVAEHPEEFADYASWGTGEDAREKTVHSVDVHRAAGLEEAQWRAEAWHLATWEPMNIGGAAQATVRTPGLGAGK